MHSVLTFEASTYKAKVSKISSSLCCQYFQRYYEMQKIKYQKSKNKSNDLANIKR